MLQRWTVLIVFWAGFATPTFADEAPAAKVSKTIGVVEDFDAHTPGPFDKGHLDSWRWTDEVRARARDTSRVEIVEGPEGGNKLLRVEVGDPALLESERLSIVRLAPYYPPEGDALRIRLRVVSGQAVIFVGGPTAYYANSDVFTEPQTIRAKDGTPWVDVVFNFNHPCWRNFRRSGFSTDAPRNYYSRWAQEPLGVFISEGTQGEFLIDRIDLVALGEGKPFAAPTGEQIKPLKTIADFEDGRLDGTFNLYMANTETEWFEESWKREKPLRFAPMTLSVAEGGLDGARSLTCTGRTAEEVHCTGVQTSGDGRANAIVMSVAVDVPEHRDTLVGGGPIEPIDVLVFVAPPDRPFPWDRFAASAELRAHSGPGFDYQISYRLLQSDRDVDFAIYQTRRYLKPGEWTRLALPAADFTCVYGHGAYRNRLLEQAPLTCEDVIAVAWLNPWRRRGQRDVDVTTRIDGLSFAHLAGSPAEHRSFWQAPDVSQLRRRDVSTPRGRILHIALPGDELTPAD